MPTSASASTRAPTLYWILEKEQPLCGWPFRARCTPYVGALPAVIAVLPAHATAILEAHNPDSIDVPAKVTWGIGPGAAAWSAEASCATHGSLPDDMLT
jgi:hypothetical protein